MKKILLIAIMAIFTTGAFAASTVKPVEVGSKNAYKDNSTTKKQKKLIDFSTCSQKASFSFDCGGGKSVVFAVVTISYDCETGRIINTDTWQSGRTCDTPEEF